MLAQRILQAKYWVATHDEVKKGGGFISWFLRRKVWTVQEALKEASLEADGEDTLMGGQGDDFANVNFHNMGNGESRVLE